MEQESRRGIYSDRAAGGDRRDRLVDRIAAAGRWGKRSRHGPDYRQANARSVVQGVLTYGGDNKMYFPPHYVYGVDQTSSDWILDDQQETNPHPVTGYVHWSYALFNGGAGVPENSFTCPEVPTMGGAPRTDPGADTADWEPNQVNDAGGANGQSPPLDRHGQGIAYVGNHALFPRNKFTLSSGVRLNRLVTSATVDGTGRGGSGTILVTENFGMGRLGPDDRWKQDQEPPAHHAIPGSGGDIYNEPVAVGRIAPVLLPQRG